MSTDADTPDSMSTAPPPVHKPLPPTSRPLDLLPPRTIKHARPAYTPDAAPAEDDLPESQPMSASPSNSSQNPDGDPSVPYGTRSRNRGPRINYADDKELDLEIEAAGRITKGNAKKSAPAKEPSSNVAATSNGFSAINSVSTPSVEQHAQPNGVGSAPAPSKKRKQPGSSATASGATTPFALGPKTAGLASHYVTSNVMSFTKSGARLNAKKQLVADDGTTLAADGKLLGLATGCLHQTDSLQNTPTSSANLPANPTI
jgi:hypothetical protein